MEAETAAQQAYIKVACCALEHTPLCHLSLKPALLLLAYLVNIHISVHSVLVRCCIHSCIAYALSVT